MKMKKIVPALVALVLVATSSVGNANAYFTTYVTAKGGYDVKWNHKEKITEEFTNWHKYVTITSDPESVPVYVRVKAFCGSTYKLTVQAQDHWYDGGDGYWYYDEALKGGESTKTPWNVGIDNIPLNPEEEQNFNVVVIYESMPVIYSVDGTLLRPESLDWSETLTSTAEGNQVVIPPVSQDNQNKQDDQNGQNKQDDQSVQNDQSSQGNENNAVQNNHEGGAGNE